MNSKPDRHLMEKMLLLANKQSGRDENLVLMSWPQLIVKTNCTKIPRNKRIYHPLPKQKTTHLYWTFTCAYPVWCLRKNIFTQLQIEMPNFNSACIVSSSLLFHFLGTHFYLCTGYLQSSKSPKTRLNSLHSYQSAFSALHVHSWMNTDECKQG